MKIMIFLETIPYPHAKEEMCWLRCHLSFQIKKLSHDPDAVDDFAQKYGVDPNVGT
jgi:hypothetical protein